MTDKTDRHASEQEDPNDRHEHQRIRWPGSRPSGRAVKWVVGVTAALVLPLSASARDDALPAGFQTQPVLKTGQTRDRDPIVYPAAGKPEMVAVTATIEAGGRTPLHEHPVPTFVYVMEGAVELQTEGGEPHTYRKGEAYIEALDRKHQLFNRGDGSKPLTVPSTHRTGDKSMIIARSYCHARFGMKQDVIQKTKHWWSTIGKEIGQSKHRDGCAK